MLKTISSIKTDRLLTPAVLELVEALTAQFGERRLEVLELEEIRMATLRNGEIEPLAETAGIRRGDWQVAPVPAELLERRVELIGGCSRKELIEGLNAGAKSYVADLWNMTPNEPGSILRAHKNIERATDFRLAYVGDDGDRIRINPKSITRLMIVPRPLHAVDHTLHGSDAPTPATFLDLAIHAEFNATKLVLRQGGVFLYLRGLSGHVEARLWKEMFELLEERFNLPRGTYRATVMMDNLAAVLEADEILHELRYHSAGLSLDPQAYAADHIALFSAPDRPVLPDRDHIGLEAKFLRSVSLRTISICHRRQAHAMGAPAYILPPNEHGLMKPGYLEMIADKEREAVDGHDGTLVGHPGLVNPAMTEFNKSMARAHQMYYQRADHTTSADLTESPKGVLTTEGMQQCIRTVIRALVSYNENQGLISQGGKLHDRSSIRLSTLLMWHWSQSSVCFITDTGLEIHADVVKYLIRKEGDKMFARQGPELKERAKQAVARLTEIVLSPDLPPDLLEEIASQRSQES